MNFLDFLVSGGYIDESGKETVQEAVEQGEDVETALDRIGLDNSKLLLAKGEYYRLPVKHLEPGDLDEQTLSLVPDTSISHYSLLPLGIEDDELIIGFVKPDDPAAREAADFISSAGQKSFRPVVITQFDFDRIRGNINTLSSEVDGVINDLEEALDKVGEEETIEEEESGSNVVSGDAPVTRIVATVLRHAADNGASDIHIEPYEKETRVRFRVDGVMKQSLVLPSSAHNALVARVKILSNMKLDEKRKPQDGRFSAHISNRKIDFRVSTFPTYHGEKVVMRLLDSEQKITQLTELGLSERNMNLITSAIQEPYGLILISGPTGSGKSTTLYSMLKMVDRDTKNVLSLEDPVEYQIKGISQSSVRPEIGYTFASGLRTTLRQDPDIIMVGEIRDKETAQLAIQAALTGHLVLSTIHTNSAIGVIPRLIDMGVDPYLIAPTLKLAIAQRLVKKLCPGSGKELAVDGGIRELINEEMKDIPPEVRQNIHVPRNVLNAEPAPGCPAGTRGRVAVFEVVRMTNKIEKIILTDPREELIYNEARNDGFLTMQEDAMIKSFEHLIPFEEVSKLGSGEFSE